MRNNKKYKTETTKFPRSIMVWGAIRSDGKRVIFRCTNNVDSKQYQDILKCQLPTIYTTRYIFQQDGASIHNSALKKHILRQDAIRCLENWLPQSPDLNIIKGLWSYLKTKYLKNNPKYKMSFGKLQKSRGIMFQMKQ